MDWLAPRDVLVVLDNCEHVIDPVRRFAERVLYECPTVTFLVTSREGLDVEGEHRWLTKPLTVPPLEVTSPAEACCYESIELFVARAAAVGARLRALARQHRAGQRHLPSTGRDPPRPGAGGGPRSRHSVRPICWNTSTSGSAFSSAPAGSHAGPCVVRSIGRTACSARNSGSCSGDSASSPGVGRSPPAGPSAAPTSTPLTPTPLTPTPPTPTAQASTPPASTLQASCRCSPSWWRSRW